MADSELRADQIASGVSFLKHPKVKENPLSQRLAFLEEKGLTPGEIQAALRAASEDGSGEESLASRQPGLGSANGHNKNASLLGAPSSSQGWSEPEPNSLSAVPRLAAASLCAAGAASGFLLRGLAADDLDGPSAADSYHKQTTADHTAVAALWTALTTRLPRAGPPEGHSAPEVSNDGASGESGVEPSGVAPGVFVGRAEAAEALALDQAVRPLALLALGFDCFGGAEAGLERLVTALTAAPCNENGLHEGEQHSLGHHSDARLSLVVGAEELAMLIDNARLTPTPPKPLDQGAIASLLNELTPPPDKSAKASSHMHNGNLLNHEAAAAVVVAAAARWDLPLEHRLQLVAGALEAHVTAAAAAEEARRAAAEATAAVATQRAAAAESTAEVLATRVGAMANELASLQAQVAALALRGGGSSSNGDNSDGTGLDNAATAPLPAAPPPVPTPQEAVAEFATKAMEAALGQSAMGDDGTGDSSTSAAGTASSSSSSSEGQQPTEEAKAAATASVVAGIDTLLMYTSNLLKKPKDPRVRRISTANQVYTKTVKKLAGAQALLEYVGFTAKGASLEYTKPVEAPAPLSASSTPAATDTTSSSTTSNASNEVTAAAKGRATADGDSQGPDATSPESNNPPATGSRLAATVAALESLRKKLTQNSGDSATDLTPPKSAPEVAAPTPASFPAEGAVGVDSAETSTAAVSSPDAPSNATADETTSAAECKSSPSTTSNVVDCRPNPANLVTQAKLDAFFKPRGNADSAKGEAANATSPIAGADAEASATVGDSAGMVDVASATASAAAADEMNSSSSQSSPSEAEPSPQLPMSEVVAMVERGERPPGIRDDLPRDAISSYQPAPTNVLNTKNSSPNSENGEAPVKGDAETAGSPPKPWEAGQANGAAELTNADSTDISGSAASLSGAAPGDGAEVQGSPVTNTGNPENQRSDQKKGKKGNKKGNKGKTR